MKYKIIFYCVLLFFVFIKKNIAQDFHFSQFDANPLYINPAMAGERVLNENKGIRFNLNYREQIGNYYFGKESNRSVAVGLDAPLSNKFTLGEFLVNNRSVDGTFNTLNLVLAGAYKIISKDTDDKNLHNLSVGVQIGFIQKSFQPNNFVYDSQYSPTSSSGFDKTLPSGENFSTESYFNFDANVGIYYRATTRNKKISPHIGFAIYHFTQPNESFYSQSSPIPIRYNVHVGTIFKIDKSFSIAPIGLYMNQAHANEIAAGLLFYYKIGNSNFEPLLGATWRNKNAIIYQVGLKTKSFAVRVSYDMNTHYLKPYNNNGLELSLIYITQKKQQEDNEFKAPDKTKQAPKKVVKSQF